MRRSRGAFRRGTLRTLAAAALLVLALPGSSRASGAWQTMLHARDFTDLLVTDDEVWCATAEAGLLRYDRLSQRFLAITREPGAIASNHLTSLALDRAGRLWVGTAEAGVSRFTADRSSWELVSDFDGLKGDSVTVLTVAGDTLWVGTRKGIALWDGRRVQGSLPDGNTVSFDTTFVLPAITGVVQLADTLWLSTPRGVGYAHTTSDLADWRKANTGLPTLQVEHLASDGADLFAQSGGGVYRWDPPTAAWVASDAIGIVHALKEDYGTVLAGTELGIWRRRAGDAAFTLLDKSPVAAPSDGDDPEPAVDPTGTTTHYAGTAEGLREQPPTPGTAVADTAWTLRVPVAPPGNTYNNIIIDDTRVYAATRSQGIGRWDGTTWYPWLPVACTTGPCPNDFIKATEVFAMLRDRNHQKWVACWGFAIERFDDSTDPARFTHYWNQPGDDPRHTLAFGAAADSNGGVWFGMDFFNDLVPLGLDFYDSTGAHVGNWQPGLPATSLVRAGKVRAVTVDKAGRIWVGYAGATNSGVDTFVRRPEQGYDFKSVTGTTSLDIWAMVAHGDSIWVLTDSELKRINRTSSPLRVVQTLKTPAGRPLSGLRLMDVAPNGDVFVGSEEGVRWYRPDGTTQNFTAANSPLASDDVRAVAVEPLTGAVWFGTADGLNRFDPAYRPPAPPAGARETLRVFPNPATLTGLGVELRLQGVSAGYTGGIYDLRGRRLRRFTTLERGRVFWDGRDENGVLVDPGVYFVRAQGSSGLARARFVLLH